LWNAEAVAAGAASVNGALLAVAVGGCGGGGAAVRLVADAAVARRWRGEIALGTVLVNVVGSAVAGVVTGLFLRGHLDAHTRLLLVTGLCGGLTTWSTVTYETAKLLALRRRSLAFAFGVGGVVLSVAVAALALVCTGT
jgi:CrcB protein